MAAQTFFFPLNISRNTAINIFIIIFISSTTNGYTHEYYNCSSPWSCGNVTNIGYPFWGSGRPSYCGHQLLRLNCTSDPNGYPVLITGDHSETVFQVLDIWNSGNNNRTVKLLQTNYPDSNACPTDFTKNVVFQDLLKFNSNVSITQLYYDCHNNNKTSASNLVPCLDVSHQKQYNYSYSSDGRGYEACNLLEVPLLKEELNKFRQGREGLRDVLNKGFEVNFNYSESRKCENSGGVCGSSENQMFVCYCKDHPHKEFVECRKSENWKLKLILGLGTWNVSLTLALGSLGGGLFILIGLIFCYKSIRPTRQFVIFSKRRAAQHQNIEAFLKIYGSLAPKRYTYANIRKITNYFKDKLGEGGYATVYKGQLHNGRLVAVKKLKQVKGNGDDFINEVSSIGRTNHVNIVTLLGFCFEGKERALIYEFMSNGSLERFTYRGASYMSLSWEKLFDIALGIAKGLDYLHRGCNARILHFDIKPHNILLDEEFRPKISDFGLARLCPQQESTISMLEARGTIGYIAPEVFCRNFGGVSHKSDVYSYGMMVLDLVCGRTNVSAEVHHSSELYFPDWIYSRLELGEEVINPGIVNDKDKDLERKMILVSLWCIQTYPSSRPSMSRVAEMLNGCLESIQMPPKPYISSPPRGPRLTSHTSGTPTTT